MRSEYDKYLKEKIPALDMAVETTTKKPASSGSEQKPAEQKPAEQKLAEQKPAEQKPTAPKQVEQKPSDTSNSGNKSYIEELREMYPGVSDEDLLSLFGDPSNFSYNDPSAERPLFGG